MRCLYELLYKLIELLLSEFLFNNNNNKFYIAPNLEGTSTQSAFQATIITHPR
jgi:hypothetical protein